MNFFRRWHAHHEFRHHFGHGHHGHPFGRPADGFAHLLFARVSAKLDLGDEQRRRLGTWLEQLQRQRDALKGLARGPGLAGLVAGEQFARAGNCWTRSWTRCARPAPASSPRSPTSSTRSTTSSARRCAS